MGQIQNSCAVDKIERIRGFTALAAHGTNAHAIVIGQNGLSFVAVSPQ
jgi:hypothetical protein